MTFCRAWRLARWRAARLPLQQHTGAFPITPPTCTRPVRQCYSCTRRTAPARKRHPPPLLRTVILSRRRPNWRRACGVVPALAFATTTCRLPPVLFFVLGSCVAMYFPIVVLHAPFHAWVYICYRRCHCLPLYIASTPHAVYAAHTAHYAVQPTHFGSPYGRTVGSVNCSIACLCLYTLLLPRLTYLPPCCLALQPLTTSR